MDLFKYLVFIIIFITLLGFGTSLANDHTDSTWDTFLDEQYEDNLKAHSQNTSIAMGDSSIVYNPQNENTQSEGLGGIGISQITLGTFKFFKTIFEELGNFQAQATAGENNTNPFIRMIWFAMGIFVLGLITLLTIKVYQFWRFGN